MNKIFLLTDIERFFCCEARIVGDPAQIQFSSIKPLDTAAVDSLVFIARQATRKEERARSTRARVILCDETFKIPADLVSEKIFIVVKDPKEVMGRIGRALFVPRPLYGRHETAIIHPEAEIHHDTYIGPYCSIGRACIGEGTILHGHNFIYDKTRIGRFCVLQAGAILGAEGFGFYLDDEEQRYVNFPHIGGVVLEDFVEVGATSCIDRGALGDTIIREGAKIDNHVQVGHNAVIGRHSIVVAMTTVGGSATTGDYAWISPNVSIRDGIHIGERAMAGIGAIITKDIPSQEVWASPSASRLKIPLPLKGLRPS